MDTLVDLVDTLVALVVLVCLGSVTLGPIVHSFQLSRIERRLSKLERAVDGLYETIDDDDDPDGEQEPVAHDNIVAIGRRST